MLGQIGQSKYKNKAKLANDEALNAVAEYPWVTSLCISLKFLVESTPHLILHSSGRWPNTNKHQEQH